MELKKLLSVLSASALIIFSTGAFAETQQTGGTTKMVTTTDAKAAGDAFLETNKSKEGVVTLPSGLQYEVLTEGTGEKPGVNDTVTVDYEGKLINGEVFDSSYKRGQPISFPVNGVIAGWTEALQLMPKGSTWMLYIPSNLAYGAAGAGSVIGPNETLIFKVHLIDVK